MITKKCQQCNKEFKVGNYRKDTAKFCSFDCRDESYKGKPAWNKGKKGIMPTPWNKGIPMSDEIKLKLSLSKKGQKAWNKGIKNPGVTNSGSFKKGNTPPLKGKHHTKETKDKLRLARLGKPSNSSTKFVKGISSWNKNKHIEAISGSNHYNWKGGITNENHKVRTSLEYKLWRDACFARDGYICQKTGQYGGKLRCHHINNFAEFPELRLAIDNGITLSDEAHKQFHRKYGVKNNTKEQLQEYLNKLD